MVSIHGSIIHPLFLQPHRVLFYTKSVRHSRHGQLQKPLEKMTAQNTQTSKELNDAKDKARQLEKQLSEASSKNGSIIWMIISIISIIALVIVLLFK